MGKNLKGKELGVGFTQRQDGRYECKVTLNGKRRTFYNKSLTDLRKVVNDARYEAEHGIAGDTNKLTLGDWFITWKKTYKKNHIRDTTLENYDMHYRLHIQDSLGRCLLKEIRPAAIQLLLNKLGEKGYSTGYINTVRVILSNMFRYAVQEGLVLRNPCDNLKIPQKPKKNRGTLNSDEQKRFLEQAKLSSTYYPIFYTALCTGMRVNEILGLTWADIDFKQSTISVNRTLVLLRDGDKGKKFAFHEPKSISSKREICMISELKTVILQQKYKQNTYKVEHLEQWNPPEGMDNLVFTTKYGMPIIYDNLNNSINTIVKKINESEMRLAESEKRESVIMEKFSMHILRHTFVTRCFENGMNPKILQEIIGHSKFSITMNIYTHPSKNIKKEAMEKISSAMIVS